MTFYPLGDTALVINFEQKIDRLIHNHVLQLCSYLQSKNIDGILFYVPAYCSLTLGYDLLKWNYEDLVERIKRFAEKIKPDAPPIDGRIWKIPVCYEAEYGLDLKHVATEKQVSVDTVIEWHSARSYYVYMLGFLPGFVYLGDLPSQLQCARKDRPRLRVPAYSVAIAGFQTGIYPMEAPGGWQILGRTPIRIFDPRQEDPFWFRMADTVNFYPVSEEQYLQIAEQDYQTQIEICIVHG